jgi:monosaccharide-transporting ATPase
MSVLFISAELEEVLRLSHRIVVLRDRHVVADLENDGLTVDSLLALIADGSGDDPEAPDAARGELLAASVPHAASVPQAASLPHAASVTEAVAPGSTATPAPSAPATTDATTTDPTGDPR